MLCTQFKLTNLAAAALAGIWLAMALPVSAAQVAVDYKLTNLSALAGMNSSASGMNATGQVTGEDSAGHAYIYSNGSLADLGTLGGTISDGTAINASGQVTGVASTTGNAGSHAFLYSNGHMSDLGTFGGTLSAGLAINANGQVTGYADFSTGTPEAFLYSNDQMTGLSLGGTYSYGYAINDSGQVTGESTTRNNAADHAFLFHSGQVTDLGTFGGTMSGGAAINASGQVTGSTSTSGNALQPAFLYSNGQTTNLGTLGGTISNGAAINVSGQVAGLAYTSGNTAYHAFIYNNGQMTDLGTLGGTNSDAYAINDSGQIVGWADISGSSNSPSSPGGGTDAFLYSNGQMLDLNSLIAPGSGLTLTDALGINDIGDIYGSAVDALGNQYAFELTPLAVPEPTGGCLLAIAALGLLRRGGGIRRASARHASVVAC